MNKEITIVKNPEKLDGLRVINDINEAVNVLQNGETICRFEYGSSMHPIAVSGQYCRLEPLHGEIPNIGDMVLNCLGDDYIWNTHMVWNVNKATGYILIGDSHHNLFGWTNKYVALAIPMPYAEQEREED